MNLFKLLYPRTTELRNMIGKAIRERLLSEFPQATTNIDWSVVEIAALDPQGIALTIKVRVVMLPRKEESPT